MKKGLPWLFGMQVYGNDPKHKYTTRVHSFFTLVALVLIAQFGLDLFAWMSAGRYALTSEMWILIIATFLSFAVFAVDLQFFLTDMKEMRTNGGARLWTMLFLRLFAMFAIPYVNSVPFELTTYADEIENRIELVEKQKIDEVREKAEDEETKRYDEKIATAKEKLDADSTKRDSELVKREKELAAYVGTTNTQRTALQTEADRAKICWECEMTGDCSRFPQCAISAGHGVGKVAEQKNRARHESQAQLAAFYESQKNDNKMLELQAAVSARLAELEQEVEDLEAEQDAAIAATKTMDPTELAVKYGGKWKQSRGFFARHQTLNELAAESDDVYWGIWGCRLVMMIFPFLLLITKFGVPEDVQSCLSVEEQARNGNPLAVTALRGKRPDQLALFGFTEDHFLPEETLRQERSQLMIALNGYQDNLHDLCKPTSNGLCRPRHEIIAALRAFWMTKVHPEYMKLEGTEGTCRERGIVIPPWDDMNALVIDDPNGIKNQPWEVETATLEQLGWIDPEPIVKTANDAQSQLTRGLQIMRTIVNVDFRGELRKLIARDPHMPLEQLRGRLFDFWQSYQNNLENIENLVAAIRRGGLEPQWLPGVPTLDELREMWRVSEAKLRTDGWKGTFVEIDTITWVEPRRDGTDQPDATNGHSTLSDDELNALITERAHQQWEDEGRPEGQAERHWMLAQAQITAENAPTTATT